MRDRRAAIAHVAAELIAEEGLERTSLRHIAGRMGATIGTLTHQFRDREDLVRTTFEITVQAVRERAARTGRGKRGERLLTALLGETIPTNDIRRVETAVWLAFAMSATTNPAHTNLYRDCYREWEDTLTRIVDDVAPPGRGDSRDIARILIATADGIALRALAGHDLSPTEQRRLLAAAVASALRPVAP